MTPIKGTIMVRVHLKDDKIVEGQLVINEDEFMDVVFYGGHDHSGEDYITYQAHIPKSLVKYTEEWEVL